MDYKETKNKVIKNAIFVGIGMCALAFAVNNKVDFVKGIVLGVGTSILMFLQMANSLEKASKMYQGSAQMYASSRYIIRLSIYALVILASIKADNISALATILGIFSIKLSILYLTARNKLN